MNAPASAPSIQGDDCVHALAVDAQCRACVQACPNDALLLDDDGLRLDIETCDGCGLCAPVCPRQAIALPVRLLDAIAIHGDRTATAQCERVSDGPGLTCRHALGVRDLDALADQGIRALTLHVGPCRACSRDRPRGGFDDVLRRHAAVRHSRGGAPVSITHIEGVPPSRPADARASAGGLDPARRSLFGALLRRDKPPLATASPVLAYFRPAIDAGRCIACDACARICPDGAITRTRPPSDSYRIEPDLCRDCGLCVDLCEHDAVTVTELAAAKPTIIPLKSQRCRACGAPYSWVESADDSEGQCRICRMRGQARTLFQVIASP